jgi:hypothetical protein
MEFLIRKIIYIISYQELVLAIFKLKKKICLNIKMKLKIIFHLFI